jgi:hypothetical protein
MATDVINAIQSLHNRDFSDYQILVEKIRPLIDKYFEENQKQLVKDKDIDGYAFRANSVDYIRNVYNEKLGEFRTNFFWNDELIRGEIAKNPNILEKIRLNSYRYLDGIISTSLGRQPNGPSELDKSMVNNDHFNRNYKSGYYLKPKPVTKQSKSEGCFVATFAYNSYEHNDVLILRKFRDNYLLKSKNGKGFVKIYYKYSPKFVELLNSIRFPKFLIRSFLKVTIIGYLKRKQK